VDHLDPFGCSAAKTMEQSLASSAAPLNHARASPPPGICSIVAAWFDANGGTRCASKEPSPAGRITPSKADPGGGGGAGPGGAGPGEGRGGWPPQPGQERRQPLVTWSLGSELKVLQLTVKQWCEFRFHETTEWPAAAAAASQAAKVFAVVCFALLRLHCASELGSTVQLPAAAAGGGAAAAAAASAAETTSRESTAIVDGSRCCVLRVGINDQRSISRSDVDAEDDTSRENNPPARVNIVLSVRLSAPGHHPKTSSFDVAKGRI
jgi:hypothetical protein